ncbi:hypothetical protein PENANT_c067G00250 [Penicillium antarcticum]|uniref:Uncharacterized protein n=1 Tax=Penicillium antarcticum TaxID=416450 RepID=A0A1V6PR34_9EURO|nr:hypothetical protein PENANT_c067G00250 [Penicillium antarcticum]
MCMILGEEVCHGTHYGRPTHVAPEPPATTNARKGMGIDVWENIAPTTTVRTGRHARVESEQTHADSEPVELGNTGTSTGRATTKEIWQIINEKLHEEILALRSQAAQVASIGTTKTRYVIRFKNNPALAETARNNKEWLTDLGNHTTLVKPRFGLAVHHVPAFWLDLENRAIEAMEMITNEMTSQTTAFGSRSGFTPSLSDSSIYIPGHRSHR